MLLVAVFTTFALLTEGVTGQQITNTCPSGFLPWQNNCYLFVDNSQVTWDQARRECQDRQAHLLRIETVDEYNFIRKAQQSYPSLSFWTALNNLPQHQASSSSNSFMWGNDEFPDDAIVQAHWDHEPLNTDDRDCVFVTVQATLSMGVCTQRAAYICELPVASGAVCPHGWVLGYSGLTCLLVSNASDWSQTRTWDQARKVCESMNSNNQQARLISIVSTAEQNFIAESLPTFYNGRMVFWTGLNDKDQEGTFVWAGDAGTPYSASTFAGKWRVEPNNLGGNEHCAVLMPEGRWDDRECEDQVNYACRLVLSNSPTLMNMGCGSWTRAGTKCVYVYNTQKTWSDARAFCQSAGGDLLAFSSRTDADWLTMQSRNAAVQSSLPGYWIGLNDQQTENTFLWTDGSEPDGSLLYWDKEPGRDDTCAFIQRTTYFATGNCYSIHAGAICEDFTATCGPNWTSYGGHCYTFVTKWKTRSEAANLCKSLSPTHTGRLFALNSQDEMNWILANLPAQGHGIPNRFWSSLKKADQNAWIWENKADQNPLTMKLVQWATEPNDYNHNEDCVEILSNGFLNDAVCTQTRGFICQKGLNSATAVQCQHLTFIVCLLVAVVGKMMH